MFYYWGVLELLAVFAIGFLLLRVRKLGKRVEHLDSETQQLKSQLEQLAVSHREAAEQPVTAEPPADAEDTPAPVEHIVLAEAETDSDSFTPEVEPVQPIYPAPATKEQTSVEPATDSVAEHDPWRTQPTASDTTTGEKRSFFSSALLALINPILPAFSKFGAVYQHYREQGKAPAFLLTIAGILALVMGLGYFLQLSYSEYLPPVGKVITGYLLAAAVLYAGTWVIRRRPDMDEFGSALLGLGVVLGYICSYFLGPYFSITGPLATFAVLALMTAFGYWLADWFQTRVVAVICLLGGALSPVIFSFEVGLVAPALYLAYLWLLSLAAMLLAYRISWLPLFQLSLVTAIGFVQLTLFQLPSSSSLSAVTLLLLHAFFYLGCVNVTLQWQKFELNRAGATSFALAVLVFFIGNLAYYTDWNTAGGLLLANAGVAAAIAYISRGEGWLSYRPLAALACLFTGALLGAAIILLIDAELLGPVLGLEGAALLYLARQLGYPSLRREGYLVLLLAAVQECYLVGLWLTDWFGQTIAEPVALFGYGYLNFAILTAQLLIAWVSLRRLLDLRAAQIATQVVGYLWPVCLSVLLYFTAGGFTLEYFWLISALLMFTYCYLGVRLQHRFLELLGLLHLVPLLLAMAIFAIEANSFRFSLQMLPGQLVRVEFFVSLLLIAHFYRRLLPEASLLNWAERLETLFYLILPVFFLSTAWRNLNDFFPIILWGSAAIAFLIQLRLPRLLLRWNSLLLMALAALGSLVATGANETDIWHGYGLPALIIGACCLAAVLKQQGAELPLIARLAQSAQPLPGLSIVTALICLYWTLTLMFSVYSLTAIEWTFYLTGAGVVLLLLSDQRLIRLIRPAVGIAYGLGWLYLLLTMGAIWFSATTVADSPLWLASLGLLAVLGLVYRFSYRPSIGVKIAHRVLKSRLLSLYVAQLAITGCYLMVGAAWLGPYLSPVLSVALVLQGTVVLFQTLKPTYGRLLYAAIGYFVFAAGKILLYDISSLSMPEKVAALMLTGILLLGAGYQYQRMKSAMAEA